MADEDLIAYVYVIWSPSRHTYIHYNVFLKHVRTHPGVPNDIQSVHTAIDPSNALFLNAMRTYHRPRASKAVRLESKGEGKLVKLIINAFN